MAEIRQGEAGSLRGLSQCPNLKTGLRLGLANEVEGPQPNIQSGYFTSRKDILSLCLTFAVPPKPKASLDSSGPFPDDLPI